MKVYVFSKTYFESVMHNEGINDSNVEERNGMFISIINTDLSAGDSFFKKNASNVLRLYFDDVTEDMEIPIIGTKKNKSMKAFTNEQAKWVLEFIKKNATKKYCFIHCTGGINRSASIGEFINDYFGGTYAEFKRLNPHTFGNPTVTSKLKEEYRNLERI